MHCMDLFPLIHLAHYNIVVYTFQLISGDVTIANLNKTGSSSGDPIISPIFGYPYQLPCTNNSYLFFDNMSRAEDRLVINVQMKVLSKKEKCGITECVEKQWDRTLKDNDVLPLSIEGYENLNWVLMDYINVVIHIFLPEYRSFRIDLPHRQPFY